MNSKRTESTDFPRSEASCLRIVLHSSAETPAAVSDNTLENQGVDGGRDRDRTCDPSRVKGAQPLEITQKLSKSTDFPHIGFLVARAFAHSPEAARKARLVEVAVRQWPNKTPLDRPRERERIERNLFELSAMMREGV